MHARGIVDKASFKYHLGALQQAKEYAESIGAPFFAVCYANSLLIRCFAEHQGLFYPSMDFADEFGLKVLRELAQLYKRVKAPSL
jgi:hypothetical protein